MTVLSVCVSLPREVVAGERAYATGIGKTPVTGRVMVRRRNLDGDGQADLSVHGGEHMAVYAYPVEHYSHWQSVLERSELPHGQFGENLTVAGLLEDQAHVGAVYQVGDAVLQVTQPRIPCFKLVNLIDAGPGFGRTFLASRRLGFYLRVLQEGEVGAGDSIELLEPAPESVTITEMVDAAYGAPRSADLLRRVLASRDLSSGPKGWREHVETLLARAEAN